MIFASAIGAGGFVWIIYGSIAGVFPKHTAAMWRLWLAVALSFVVVDDGVKKLFDRARPFDVDPSIRLIDARPDSPSFPSGHAATAVAGALAGSQMIPGGVIVLWPLAALVMLSRIYLGVHWPTDVAAGALIGLFVGWFVLGRLRR